MITNQNKCRYYKNIISIKYKVRVVNDKTMAREKIEIIKN
jgi:hypothetical protein